MFEGSMILLAIGIVFAGVAVYYWIQVIAESVAVRKDSPSDKGTKRGKAQWSFRKKNYVEGVLTVNGMVIPTYKIGTLELGGAVEMDFFDNGRGNVQVTDILYNGESLFLYAPAGTYRDKCDYAIQVLKSMTSHKTITRELSAEVERIILQVDELNRYVTEGKIKQVANGDFAWCE